MRKEAIIILLVVTVISSISAVQIAELSSLPKKLIACENTQFSHEFQVVSDSEIIQTDISPKDIFFARKTGENKFEIFSVNLTKSQTGREYARTIFTSNEAGLSYEDIIIKVLEKNEAPTIEDVRVQTISLDREAQFSKKIFALDIEDGNQDSGKLKFDVKFKAGQPIFSISNGGEINFSTDKTEAGVYLVEVCVRDSGLALNGENYSECGEDGTPKTACDDFQLSVTEIDRPPTIVSKNPSGDVNATVGDKLVFKITTFDPDGSAGDVYWYVDGNLSEFDSGLESLEKSFFFNIQCNDAGEHTVRAEVTDGLLKDSVSWKILAKGNNECKEALRVIPKCEPKWGCEDWNVCQHAAQSMQFGSLPNSEYQKIILSCNSQGLSQEICGFQIRKCIDVNSCNKADSAPSEIQACTFGLNPSCSDNIKNCHDGSCEIGIDCGGNCGKCASCSDGIKNQNEDGIDCGGICANICPTEEYLKRKKLIIDVAIGIVAILIILILYKAFKVLRFERELSKYAK